MILIVTNRNDHTADFLILELQRRGANYFRLNSEDLPELARIEVRSGPRFTGAIRSGPKSLDIGDVTSVWYRRPGTPRPSFESRDAAVTEFSVAESQAALQGVLSALDVRWVSHPHLIQRAESKLLQLQTAARLGFRVPKTLVTNDPECAREFLASTPTAIYKPMRRGRIPMSAGPVQIFTNVIDDHRRGLLDAVALAPCLFQEYVPKDFEVRVTVIGRRCFAAAIHSQDQSETKTDWRRADPSSLRHTEHALPAEVSSRCGALVEELGLTFGAIDLIVTPDREYVFLEINPNGQWAWVEQLCPTLRLREALADLLLGDDVG